MPELTDEQLADIRHRYVVGLTALLQRIGAAHGVGADCIEAIVHGRPWRHLVSADRAGDLFGKARR